MTNLSDQDWYSDKGNESEIVLPRLFGLFCAFQRRVFKDASII